MPSLSSMAKAFALPFALSLLLLTVPGCGKKDADTASSANADGSGDASSEDGDGNDGGGATEIVTDMTPDSFNQLKQMWDAQIAGVEAQSQMIVQAAAEQTDAQLTDIANKLKAKSADMRSKFNALTYPSGMRAIQADVPKWMSEASELIAEGSGRLMFILNQKATAPTTTPG